MPLQGTGPPVGKTHSQTCKDVKVGDTGCTVTLTMTSVPTSPEDQCPDKVLIEGFIVCETARCAIAAEVCGEENATAITWWCNGKQFTVNPGAPWKDLATGKASCDGIVASQS